MVILIVRSSRFLMNYTEQKWNSIFVIDNFFVRALSSKLRIDKVISPSNCPSLVQNSVVVLK